MWLWLRRADSIYQCDNKHATSRLRRITVDMSTLGRCCCDVWGSYAFLILQCFYPTFSRKTYILTYSMLQCKNLMSLTIAVEQRAPSVAATSLRRRRVDIWTKWRQRRAHLVCYLNQNTRWNFINNDKRTLIVTLHHCLLKRLLIKFHPPLCVFFS